MKKTKYILPALFVTPLVGITGLSTSCGSKPEDEGVPATKVTITNVADQQEFDIQNTKKLELKAKVEPAEADQEVTYELLKEEGTGNISCSSKGTIYTNGCVGTITVMAWSKGKKIHSDPIELVFWDSTRIKFFEKAGEGEKNDECYVAINDEKYKTIEDIVVPTEHVNPTTGKTFKVNGLYYGAFNGALNLSYVRLPKNSPDFKYIGTFAFYQCTSLSWIWIPDTVVLVDDGAFYGCTNLQSAHMSENCWGINSSAFYGCAGLVEINWPETLTYIGAMAFYQCTSLEEINIPKSCIGIGEAAFANCWKSKITVDGKEEGKTDYFSCDKYGLYDANRERFLCCQYRVKSVTKEFTVFESIKRIDAYACSYCTALEKVTFPENSQCTSIGEAAFSLCTNLSEIHLPKGLQEIKTGTFSYCYSLSIVEMPKQLQVIMPNAFYGCDNLEQVVWHMWDEKEQEEAKLNTPRNTWIIYNYSVDPAIIIDEINVQTASGLATNWLANVMIAYGYFIEPTVAEKATWNGGYSNCIWYRSDIFAESKNTIVGIEVKTPPTKTTYTAGEKLNLDGLEINAVYGDGTRALISNDKIYTDITTEQALKTTDTRVKVCLLEDQYKEISNKPLFRTVDFKITVNK